MKRLFFILAAMALTIGLFTGCEKKHNEADAIIGHSYKCTAGDEWELFYFSSSGTSQLVSHTNGTTSTFNNFFYVIDGCNVEVHYDYSSYWKAEVKGQLLAAFTYYPDSDCLLSSFGDLFLRVN